MIRSLVRIAVPAIIAVAALSAAPTAMAETYCVGAHPDCPGAPTHAADADGLQAALTAAAGNPGADIVLVAAGTYEDTTGNNGFDITSSQPLQIIGAGATQTILRGDDNSENVLMFNAVGCAPVTDCVVKNMGFELYGVPTGLSSALSVSGGSADNVRAEVSGNPGNARAVLASQGAVIENSELVTAGTSGIGGGSASSGSMYRNVTIRGTGSSTALYAPTNSTGTATIERVRITGFRTGISYDGGTVNVSDTFIDLGAALNGFGINAANGNAGTQAIILDADRLTIVGSGNNQTGIHGQADNGTESFDGDVDDTLIRLTGTTPKPLSCRVNNGWTATLDATFVAHDPASNNLSLGDIACSGSVTSTIDLASVTPKFVDAAGGDFRPTFDSPLVDAGNPATAPGAEAKDLGGLARLVDGNADGTAKVDIGAFEYQRRAPTGLGASAPTSALVGAAVQFTGTAATDPDGETVTHMWSFGDGSSSSALSPTHTYQAAGTYQATLTATDQVGVTSTAQVSIVVTAPTTDDTGGGGDGGEEPADTTAPTLGTLFAPKLGFVRPLRGGAAFATAPSTYKGPVLRGSTTEAGRLRITLQRVVRGGKRGTRCITPRPAGTVACTKLVKVTGAQVLTISAKGQLRLRFSGRFGGRLLARGTFRAALRMTDAAGNASKVRYVTFRLR